MNGPAQWVIDLPDEAATIQAAMRLAGELRAGDLVTLGGDLGAGKTTFVRALIRSVLADPAAEIPSPTYTLLQTYEGPRFNIVHADLYRITDPAELAELGWEDAAENALVLVEWAERAGEILATDRLEVHLATTGPTGAGRRLTLTGHGSFAGRLARARQIQAVLDRSGFGEARRDYMLGDASIRAYERLTDEATGRKGILMIAPRRPDGPPIRLGKPYSTLVHLAESVHAFVAVGEALRREGFSAPEIYGADLDAGLLVIEDLGLEGVIDANGPIPERYRAAVEMLAALHGRKLPAILPVEPGQQLKLHGYDLEALTIEAELLLDWYFPYAAKRSPNASVRLSFVDHWVSALEPVVSGPKTWTLRDFHSPNLIWLAEREGHRKVGLIDYQDCVLGHPAYDVVSLTQDARVTVPEALELQLIAAYVRARRMAEPAFDVAGFTAAYALLGAQRATKILGIFIRLDRRDGKPAYMKHLPRVETYLKRCLAHPALAKLRRWYEVNLPGFAPPPEAMHARNDADHPRDAAGGGSRHADAPADG
ncbi:MAG: tRNA (adenosine(37)-N6)-threonylcarbamoyltransferase complex ATPase subunit type 1 TsaE [Methylobacterium sp.]|jgi:tRNA threonylcarbamoyl adenosine modification protein YjeE|nr:tRNA (adenosine(37)-N6)-threonylcarbamoyltransferase complex ATPase subunit type 1 TsaE [Methylobacterium sp.]